MARLPTTTFFVDDTETKSVTFVNWACAPEQPDPPPNNRPENDPRDTESPEFIDRLTDEGFEVVERDPNLESPFDEADYGDDGDDDDDGDGDGEKTLEQFMDDLTAIDHYPGQDGSGWDDELPDDDEDAPLFPEDAEDYVAPDIDAVIEEMYGEQITELFPDERQPTAEDDTDDDPAA